MIYTFYSYKGGVGRSMALANVAELFYQAGLKVLMVDWDLEAPGLERFFPITHEEFDPQPGLMDLLLNYKHQMTEELDFSGDELPFQKPEELIFDIYPDRTSEGKLWLLSAGKRSNGNFGDYASNVRNFDWKDFYENWEGELYFEWLRQQFKKIADVIFIDSRTGVNEMGGVCTYQFADVIVMLTTASDQSLNGTLIMLKQFKNPRVEQIRERPLEVVVVPARVDYSESNLVNHFRDEFNDLFAQFTPKKLGSKPNRLWQLVIPYVPRYSYKEILAVHEKQLEHPKIIIEAFSKLASALSVLADDNPRIRQKMPETLIKFGQDTLSRIQVTPDIVTLDNNIYIESEPYLKDWGNAPDVNIFFGRSKELIRLEKWIIQGRCRLVVIWGMGGIGKTDLSLKLAKKIQDEFDYVIWRSLLNSPSLNDLLMEIIKYLSKQEVIIQDNLDRQLSQLLNYLRSNRCLLILDNVETILQGGEIVGQYRDGYEEYGQFFKLIGEDTHQSCLLLTTRETPPEITRLAEDNSPVRSLELRGLNLQEGREIFNRLGDYSGEEKEWKRLFKIYDGNPLALELAARYIADEFSYNISNFLKEKIPVFADLKDLLDWHFNRLSEGEQEIMYWLAINRESVSVQNLIEDVITQQPSSNVPLNIQSLQWRFRLEENKEGLTIQPVIIEYVTERLIDEICQEIQQGAIKLFNSHALIKATAKDYIRETQTRLILKPIIDKLSATFTSKELENRFSDIIASLREFPSLYSGYAGGNILNLLIQIKADLIKYNFSELIIRQAYLRDIPLHRVNFQNSEITKSIFTENFSSILSVAFSPQENGKYLAAGDADGKIRLWQVDNLEQYPCIDAHSSWVRSIAFSPDGKILASGSDDQLVKLWDVSDLSNVQPLKTLQEHTYRVRSVAFNPVDGRTLASSSFDRTVKLWDVNTGKCIKTFKEHTDWVWTASFSPDGQQLVSSSQDGTVILRDINTGKYRELLSNRDQQIQSFAFSSDGQILAGASDDKTIKLWDLKTNKYIKPLKGHTDYVRSVAFNNKGSLASAGYDNTVRLWNIKTGECTQVLKGHTHRLRSIAFSPDGKTLASGGWDQILKLWDISNISKGNESLRTLHGRTDWICAADISPDGRFIVSGSDDKTVNLWDIDRSELLKTLKGHDNWVWAVAFSPDGKLIASGGFDKKIKLWDVSTGECLSNLMGDLNWVWAVAFSPDGKLLASASDEQAVKMWDVNTGNKLREFSNDHSGWVRSVSFSPDGKLLASGSDDNKVRLWDVNTGDRLEILEGHQQRVRSVAFSPDGKFLASGSYDKTIRIWNISTSECIHVLEGHTDQVRSVAFNRRGDILASGGNDKTVRLWNTLTGECFKVSRRHTDEVRSVSFSRNTDTLVSSSKDGTLRLWDGNTGDFIKLLRRLRPYEGMKIAGVTGLNQLQKASLKSLGAVEQ